MNNTMGSASPNGASLAAYGAGEGPARFEGPAGGTTMLEGPAQVGEVGIAVPGVLLLDVSWSMQAELIGAQSALESFTRSLRQHGVASPNAYIGICTFADSARTELPLTRIADPLVAVPQLTARGDGTNFHAAFTEALTRFRTDLPQLARTAEGGKRQIFRPTLYVVTDGEHNTGGDWRVPLAELRSRSWRPNIMAFGFGNADRNVIREIASEGMAYFAADGQTPDTMLNQILMVILRSMISATVTANDQTANPAAPATMPVVDPKTDPATAGLALIDPIGSTID